MLSQPNKKYVIAFPGIRDQYKLVESLHRLELLDAFLTDFYDKGLISKLLNLAGKKHLLKNRKINGLNKNLVIERPLYSLITRLLLLFFQKSKVYAWDDDRFAKASVREAKRRKSNLILYEFQAGLAFRQKFNYPVQKVLFQFHPHPVWEHPILLKEAKRYPVFLEEVLQNTRQNLSSKYRTHTYDSFTNADKVIVASSLTKKSLISAGCREEIISVVPYGFDADETKSEVPAEGLPEIPFFLFVGSGSFRKGLHNLLNAWNASPLQEKMQLIVIARVVDKAIEPMLESSGAKWIKGVPKPVLNWYFEHAKAFVLPSFSEGFGQVYLEALSRGCPVIGTENSMLADIAESCSSIKLVEPGDEKAIQDALMEVAQTNPEEIYIRKQNAKILARDFTWTRFFCEIEIILNT